MKIKFAICGILCGILSLGLLTTQPTFGQNALQFTGVSATPEKSILIHWASNTNEYYEIDYADSLNDTNTGLPIWKMLYDDYPSQGTNTFWQDAGNFNATPEVPHPKNSPMRFYRVSLEGTNTFSDSLSVAITSLTNGAVVSGNVTVTVAASSSQILSTILLYLDGKEMPRSLDGSNFVFDTCESWNGSHTLFAVAKSQSGMEGFRLDSPITYDRAVSAMVNVTFENLITDYSFSQDFFQPSLGQTQQVSANFTANCDWTFQIFDSDSNAVRTVTGSGKSMSFNWDGTGDGETNIPDAVYTYLLTANTNGLPMSLISGSSPVSLAASNKKQLWVLQESGFVPLAIFPIGFDTNGLTIIKATESQVDALTEAANPESAENSTTSSTSGGGFFTPMDAGGAGSGQDAGSSGAKNAQGTIGVCYQRYLNTSISTHAPLSGFPTPLAFVGLDGATSGSSSAFTFPKLLADKGIADDFCKAMKKAGYFPSFEYGDDDVKINDLKKTSEGGNSIFNNVNFGWFIGHGDFGSTAESDSVKYTYVWIMNLQNGSATYLRLSDFDFGGTQPSGLRWMTVDTCSSLNQTCYNSMKNDFKSPINSNLHLLLGASTTKYTAPDFGLNYSRFLLNGETIINAWNDTGKFTYSYQAGTNMIGQVVKFAFAGSSNCTGDALRSFTSPNGDLTFGQTQVYPSP